GVLDADGVEAADAGGCQAGRRASRPRLGGYRLGGHRPVHRGVDGAGELPDGADGARGGDERGGQPQRPEVDRKIRAHRRPWSECPSWRLRGLSIATVPARRLRATASPPWIVVTQGTPTLRAAWRITLPSERARPPRGVLITRCTSPARMRSRVSRGPSPTLLTASAAMAWCSR